VRSLHTPNFRSTAAADVKAQEFVGFIKGEVVNFHVSFDKRSDGEFRITCDVDFAENSSAPLLLTFTTPSSQLCLKLGTPFLCILVKRMRGRTKFFPIGIYIFLVEIIAYTSPKTHHLHPCICIP